MTEYSTLEQIKLRLKQFHIETVENEDGTSDVVVFDDKEDNPLIEQLIKQATQEIITKRCYPASYTQEQIEEDIEKYQNNIINLVVYDHSQAGENFMSSYSENGVSRNWRDREDLFVGIYPFIRSL
mgnify:CR=1 FL=1|jgi:hypothetical protein